VQASIDPEPDNAHEAPVRVSVIEARPRSFEGGLSYTTDTQFRANVRYSDADFDDKAARFLVDGRVDRKIQQLTFRLTRPPDRDHDLDTVEANAERTDIEDLVTTTAFAGVNRRTLDERDHTVYRAYYYLDDQRPAGAPSIRSRALYLEVERTWRRVDDLIAPTRGFVLGTHWGGGPPGVSTEPFGRIVVQFAHWHPFTSDTSLKLRAEAGAVLAKSREGIPSALLFRTGGDTTVRGYAFESLGVRSGDATVPGRYYAIGSIEADHYVTPAWGLAAFVDAGNAADDLAELRPVLGYGVGVRIRSPIGPLRVDVAYGQETRQVRLHLSVGLSF
jgi:translocation and assembly module TamA